MCLVLAVWLLLRKTPPRYNSHVDFTGLLSGFCLLTAVIAFVSDLIFRKFIPSLKKLWIIESVLIVFIIILIFLIKGSI